MPRIPYPENLSESVRASLGASPPNVSRMMAGATEAVYNGFGKFNGALLVSSELPATLRELAILRVGYLSGASYEIFQHESLALHVGLTQVQIDAIRAGDRSSSALDEAQLAVLDFVDDVVENVRASDETLAAVRSHLNDTKVLDLLLTIGTYMMVSRFLETTGVEIDPEPVDWNTFFPKKG